uniref:Uncharacterized protein n=1 Tax=Rhipicephalus microplus TaxID=6941 RepID=A0A6G5AG51_RHIMP
MPLHAQCMSHRAKELDSWKFSPAESLLISSKFGTMRNERYVLTRIYACVGFTLPALLLLFCFVHCTFLFFFCYSKRVFHAANPLMTSNCFPYLSVLLLLTTTVSGILLS